MIRIVSAAGRGLILAKDEGVVMSETIAALLVFLFPLAYSPGPGNMVFAAIGARFGLRATLPASAGYHLATWVVTAAIGIGLAGVLAANPELFAALRVAGAAYVLWLAWRLVRAGAARGGAAARPATFADGVVLLALNPKAYVIIALMFTQFLGPAGADRLVPVLVITTVFTLNNLVAFTAWTVLGDRLGRLFARAGSARVLNTGFGAVLAGVAVWMLFA
jgi:threonine/homoserine/homoserine lactone efflux protein